MSVALRIKDLCLRVPGRVLISGLSLQADRGEAVAVVGSSGVGKTSLLNAILGMFPIGGGIVEVCGVDVGGGSARQVRELRRRLVGMVFQDSRLLDGLTAAQNVALPARIAGMSAGDALAAARVALAKLEVDPDTVAEVLSGGEAQRVALARAVVNRPELILADEPTGSLDSQLRDHVAELLFALPASHQCALVVVTHDPQIAARADTTIKLTPPPTQPDPQH